MDLQKQLEEVERRFENLSSQMADPEVISDPEAYRKSAKAHRDLEEVVTAYRDYKKSVTDLDQARAMLVEKDPELREMAEIEIAELEPRVVELSERLQFLLLPKDPNDDKNVLVEIRAGAGGDEASLFASEVFRMYARYAETKGWKIEVTSTSDSEAGGSKEVIALINGDKVYSKLKYESGVHRVQRVPVTEQQGRIHTSTITVAVLPEADDIDVKLEAKDVRTDTFCSSGPGGHPSLRVLRGFASPTSTAGRLLPGRKITVKNAPKAERGSAPGSTS